MDPRLQEETRDESTATSEETAPRLPVLTVLCHPDASRTGERAVLDGLGAKEEEGLSRLEPLFAPPGGGTARPLADPHISRSPLLLRRTPDGGVEISREQSSTRVRVDARFRRLRA